MRATVLVGLDLVAVDHDATLRALAEACGGASVVAYLQRGEPSLTAVLADLDATDEVDEVRLVGVVLGAAAPAASWLGRVAAHHVRERAGGPPVLVARDVVREAEPAAVDAAMARSRPVSGSGAPLRSEAWEEVPSHRHHLLVCRGPRCSARGGDAVGSALDDALQARGLGDDDVLVTHTGCLFPCNHAPVVCVQPDDVWYGGLAPGDADAVVGEHLVDGRPLERARLARRVAGTGGA